MLFGTLGLAFYTALYVDITIHNPAPFNASGLPLVLLQILIWGTLAATVVAALDYALRGVRLLSEQETSDQTPDSHPASPPATDSPEDRDG